MAGTCATENFAEDITDGEIRFDVNDISGIRLDMYNGGGSV